MTNEKLKQFYETDFMHHEDLNGDVKKVSDQMPYFRNKPIWIDVNMKPKYVNKAEEKILKENKWPVGMRAYLKEA